MVEAAENWLGNDAAGGFEGSGARRILPGPSACDRDCNNRHRPEHAPQMVGVHDDKVIEAFAPDRADQPLDPAVLPG